MYLKTMIERLITLREKENRYLTLVAVCPNSDAVLEAAIIAAQRNNAPMLFAATLNQVDRDGGYTGWTPAAFVNKMRGYMSKYNAHSDFFPCLDHGGQWLKDAHTRDRLSYEATTAEVKESITAMLAAGYHLFHIDPTVDRDLNSAPPLEVVVARSVELIAHTESERLRLGLPPVAYEVGTEEVSGGLVDLSSFETFLRRLHEELQQRDLLHAFPAFVVAQVGTNLHTAFFDREAAARLYQIVAPYGSLVKGHYTDWVENPADYPLTGMGGANIGPEFTAVEYDALLTLVQREQDLCQSQPITQPSGFMEALTQAVDASNRWQKWRQADEEGMALQALRPERRDWMLRTCARYIWTAPEVTAARQRLYTNLEPFLGDPHALVLESLVTAIERYIVAFHLFNARGYFED